MPFVISLQLIRRKSKALISHTSARHRRMVYRLSKLFAPRKWHMTEKNLTYKDDDEPFFAGLAIQKSVKGKAYVHLLAHSFAAQVALQLFGYEG